MDTTKRTISAARAHGSPSLNRVRRTIDFAHRLPALLRPSAMTRSPYMAGLVYGAIVLVMGHGLGDFVLEESGHLAFGIILAGRAALAFRSTQPALARTEEE